MTKRVRRTDLDKKLKELEAKAAEQPSVGELRCLTCRHDEAKSLITGFFERKRDGRTTINFAFFFNGCLQYLPGYKASYSTALTHVRRHLGVDPLTGNKR